MPTAKKTSPSFSDFEQKAMRERALELKAEAKMSKSRAEGEKAIMAKISDMPEPDKSMATKIHEIVTKNAPMLMPKTWYGMPAYANKDGKVVCFFQSGAKYESRYCTFGFQDSAHLDDGNMWPASFALVNITAAEEKLIAELVKKAVA